MNTASRMESNGVNHTWTEAQNLFISITTCTGHYAIHSFESGKGLRYIQEILGYNSPKTTMLYTMVSGKRLSEVRSPLDDLEI